MLMAKVIITVLCAFIFTATVSAQLREIPKEVKESFEKQYPAAQKVSYTDNLVDVHVVFYLDTVKNVAKYTNKGIWKETDRGFSFEKISNDVKVGFEKSKYADWPVTEVAIIEVPNQEDRIRIKVEKGELTKRYLFFNKEGRLIRDAITL
jgi:hypothetical protein